MIKYKVSEVASCLSMPLPLLRPTWTIVIWLAITGAWHPAYAQIDTCRFSIELKNEPTYQALLKFKEKVDLQPGCGCIVVNDKLRGYNKKISYKAVQLSGLTIIHALDSLGNVRDTPSGLCLAFVPKNTDSTTTDTLAPGSINFTGRVLNDSGEPLEGTSIELNGTTRGTATDANGFFSIMCDSLHHMLAISNVSYLPREINVFDPDARRIILTRKQIDETPAMVNTGYTWVKQKLTTGSFYKIDRGAFNIPTTFSFSESLTGRAASLLVSPSNGVSGSFIKLLAQGYTSLGLTPGSGNLPTNGLLVIFDGIPVMVNMPVNVLKSIAGDPNATGSMGGISALNFINKSEIESVEMLTGATATSIYGSKGANGVLLITTKKGKPGKPKLTVQVYTGIGNAIATRPLLNTSQYLAMRREAMANDNIIPDTSNAWDLTVFDTTRNINHRKILLGNTAKFYDAQLSFSGGDNTGTKLFRVSTWMHRETSILPTDVYNQQIQVSGNFIYNAPKDRFHATIGALCSFFTQQSISDEITPTTHLPPDAPPFLSPNGHIIWYNLDMGNPWAYLLNVYKAKIRTVIASTQLSYSISDAAIFKVNFGINNMADKETSIFPKEGQNPYAATGPITGSANFATNNSRSWIVEPQFEYRVGNKKGAHVTALIGSTFQEQVNNREIVYGTGYTNDALLGIQADAPYANKKTSSSRYKYEAIFASINFTAKNRYIADLIARRDGSSRFGPQHQFANFGAVGLAWIVRVDTVPATWCRFIKFFKIKGSFGTTGNDQIGDYMYLDTWSATINGSYNNSPTLSPNRLINSAFAWEETKKLDLAADMEFVNRIKLTVTWFRNKSSNQTVSYLLPSQTGFVSITGKNQPVVIQNSGFEFVGTKNWDTQREVGWKATVTFAVLRNILLSFPGLATSPYSKSLVEGKSLTQQKGYRFKDVNPQSGTYERVAPQDSFVNGNTDPRCYGSVSITFHVKKWQFEVLVEGRAQLGGNPLAVFYNTMPPGSQNDLAYNNQTTTILNHWRNPGDRVPIQKLTSSPTSMTANAINYYIKSDQKLIDASYLRMKSVSLSYTLPDPLFHRYHFPEALIYLQAQNLFTLTSYRDADPVTQNPLVLPPLTVVTCGLRITF